MPDALTKLDLRPAEGGTLIITAALTDEDGAPVVPSALAWSLYEGETIVNGRESVAISPLAATVQIVLTGPDLALAAEGSKTRVLVLEGTYASTLGTLHLRAGVQFTIADLPGT